MYSLEVLGNNFVLGEGQRMVVSKLTNIKNKLNALGVECNISKEVYTDKGFNVIEINVACPDKCLTLVMHQCHEYLENGTGSLQKSRDEYRLAGISVQGLTWVIGLQLALGLNRVSVVNKLYGRRSAGNIDKNIWNVVNGLGLMGYKLLTSDSLYNKIMLEAGPNAIGNRFEVGYQYKGNINSRWDCVNNIWVTFDETDGKKVRNVAISAEYLVDKASHTMAAGTLV